ncbi:glycerol-3-phosphate dehydrogenase [Bradyrhizobium sp. Tv2a-2]|uniref:glycerol-3-phosphate dehydrogenase n=1 Tax=Bradyrhizobium sp. Tv2a-2 TaxID=113395 RepID=UPI00042A9364|nr:glycerol-3-phosphate dehydrogenase [Bradyrhizobium sp. Tv2a-2]
MADYDLAIIGGGLNGASLARDAAGRGLRVILIEQGDLASAASAAGPPLIHGDPALLERRRWWRVRTQLAERERWIVNAPHLVRPMRFAVPLHPKERPPSLLRAGLMFYDRLASPTALPLSQTVDVTHHPIGNPLQRPFGIAFEYSDAVVDATRLVVANAVDAAERGAVIMTGARCVRADRGDAWRLAVIDRGHRRLISARALANTTGAWAQTVNETILRQPPLPRQLRPLQASQMLLPRLFDTDNVYVFQHRDGRLIFASPYERDFSLVGSVTHAFTGDPAIVAMPARDITYFCEALARYLRAPVHPTDVVRTLSGVNLAQNVKGVPRDGVLLFDPGRRRAPLITMLGGEITTARRRAERAVSLLTPFYPMSPRWTATARLPGGDFAWDRFDTEVDIARERWRFLSEREAQRLVGAYGSRLAQVLGEAKNRDELGQAFGPELTEAEVRYLMTKEWARFPEDILWRRTKLGLTMQPSDRDALAVFMGGVA